MNADLRVAVLSDVHGNFEALSSVLAEIDRRGPFDRVVVAGDLCLNGPDPARCVDLIVTSASDLLIGNTDRDIVDEGADDTEMGGKKRASIRWCRWQLGCERLSILDGMRFETRIVAPDGQSLLVVHANPIDLERGIFPDTPIEELDELMHGVEARVMVFGHTHIPFRKRYHGIQLFNVAACGAPRDGDRRAVWGEFSWSGPTGWRGLIRRVSYDFGGTVLRILESGMPNPDRRIRDLLRASYV